MPVPQPVGEAMGLDGVEALEVEHRLDEAVGRGIAVIGRDDVGAERFADVGGIAQRVGEGCRDGRGRHLRMVEALADALDDRVLEASPGRAPPRG